MARAQVRWAALATEREARATPTSTPRRRPSSPRRRDHQRVGQHPEPRRHRLHPASTAPTATSPGHACGPPARWSPRPPGPACSPHRHRTERAVGVRWPAQPMAGADVVVIGGGIVGAALAWRAHRRRRIGHPRRPRRPRRATDAGAGIISPATIIDDDDTLARPVRCRRRPPRTAGGRFDTSWSSCGSLSLATRESDLTCSRSSPARSPVAGARSSRSRPTRPDRAIADPRRRRGGDVEPRRGAARRPPLPRRAVGRGADPGAGVSRRDVPRLDPSTAVVSRPSRSMARDVSHARRWSSPEGRGPGPCRPARRRVGRSAAAGPDPAPRRRRRSTPRRGRSPSRCSATTSFRGPTARRRRRDLRGRGVRSDGHRRRSGRGAPGGTPRGARARDRAQ